ncbi:MAG: hypothetical protein GTO14_11670 [Anaerolineales bacterium]|nr:hypothetical protein [Anaerolineales bacterium]
MNEDENWKRKTILIGGLIGALTGVGAAYLIIQRAEKEGAPPKLGAGEGFRVGITLLGLLRQIAQAEQE